MQEITYKELTNANDAEYILEVYQPTCIPCKMLEKKLETIEDDYQLPFYKINAIENRDIITDFNIQGTPFLVFYKNEQYFTTKGIVKLSEVRQMLEGYEIDDS